MYSRVFDIIFLLIISFFSVAECHEALTKHQQWDNVAKEVDSWVDGLGYPIDQGIKETVIVLNLLGFPTRQSCEGHLNHGEASPWIDFAITQPEFVTLQNQVSDFYQVELKESFQTLRIKYPLLSRNEIFQTQEGESLKPAYEKFLYLHSLFQNEAKKILLPLFELLDKFYQTHECTEDQKLDILIEGIIRLRSRGWEMQNQRSGDERNIHLKLYVAEMNAFTKFLKDYFFQQTASNSLMEYAEHPISQ
ncbi:MAG: hypothetical protein CK425_03710 [Parachlamydia sp.]|nr:MAG: hypothetical protein CK425_03710 [Parachlamydia sp.]